MALQKATIERVFVIEKTKRQLPDPNPVWNPTQVMKFFASEYPELTNATCNGPEVKKDQAFYTFKTILGTKG